MLETDDGATDVVWVGTQRLSSELVQTFPSKPEHTIIENCWITWQPMILIVHLAAKKKNRRVVVSTPSSRKGLVNTWNPNFH